MDKNKKQTNQIIKDLYKDLQETAELNHPEVYLMPKALFDQIIKRIGHLQDYLKEDRKLKKQYREERDNWKAKYQELKKSPTSSIANNKGGT